MNPSLSINGHIYHGPLEPEAIFNELCHSYKLDHRPKVCEPNFDIEEVLGHFEDDFVPDADGFSFTSLILFAVIVLLFNVYLFVRC